MRGRYLSKVHSFFHEFLHTLFPMIDFVDIILRRIPIEDVPCGSDEEVSQWCRQLFVEKVSTFGKRTISKSTKR
jgi:c-di-GMP-related signal transduction protein